MKLFYRILGMLLAITAATAVTGCVDDLSQPEEEYGFVQFRLLKSGSFPEAKANAGVLDSLYEASKLKVTLRNENNETYATTVPVMEADASVAEYGL